MTFREAIETLWASTDEYHLLKSLERQFNIKVDWSKTNEPTKRHKIEVDGSL